MKIGDIIKFKKTGRVGTIIKVGRDFIDDSAATARVLVHNWSVSGREQSSTHLFRMGHLEDIAEVISASR